MTWDLLNEDCLDISDWVDADTGTAVSEVSPSGQFRLDTNAGAAGNAYAYRHRDFGSTPNTFTLEVKLYHDNIGVVSVSSSVADHFQMTCQQADEYVKMAFASDGLFIYDTDLGGYTEVGTNLVKEGGSAEWQTWRFLVTFTGATGNGTCDVYLNDSTHDWEKVGTAIACSYDGAATDGKITLIQWGSTTDNMVTHVNYVRAATGLEVPMTWLSGWGYRKQVNLSAGLSSDVTYGHVYNASNGTEIQRAFDNSTATFWTANNPAPQWVGVDYTSTRKILKVRIKPYDRRVKDFKIYGSNTDFTTNLVELYSGTHGDNANWEDFVLSATGNYRYYVVYVTNNYSGANVAIYEIEMMEGAGTDCQVKLLIGESSGAGVNDFHVEEHSTDFPAAKDDGGDLRFTDNDGETLLDFWVESITGTTPNRVATVWVKVDDDLGSNQSIYCYYGESGASNVSNGDNTFLFFDDFDSGVYDEVGSGSGSYGLSNSIVTLTESGKGTGLDYGIKIKASYSFDYLQPDMIMARCRPTALKELHGFYFRTDDYNQSAWFIEWQGTDTWGSTADGSHSGGNDFEIIYDILNHSSINGSCPILLVQDDDATNSAESEYDWVLIRKYNTTEPDFSTSESEEETPTHQKTINSDTAINQPDIQKTINIDGIIIGTYQKTTTSDAKIINKVVKTIVSDVTIKQTDVQKVITSDGDIKGIVQKTINSDSYIKGEGKTNTINSDAIIKQTGIQEVINTDANIAQIGLQKTITADAFICYDDLRKTINSDTDIIGTYQETTTSDAKIANRVEKTINTNAFIRYHKDFYARHRIANNLQKDFYTQLKINQPAPVDPTGLSATDLQTGEAVELTWTDTGNYGYNIYKDVGSVWIKQNEEVLTDATSYIVGSLTANVTYTFLVRGVNGIDIESTGVQTTGTPTFNLANYTTAPIYVIYVDGSPLADAVLESIDLCYGPSFSTASFYLPKKHTDPGVVVASGQSVSITVNGRQLFSGYLLKKTDTYSASDIRVSYIVYSKLWDYTQDTVNQSFNEPEYKGHIPTTKVVKMLKKAGCPYNVEDIELYDAINAEDTTQLEFMTSMIRYIGNYKIYTSPSGVTSFYKVGTGRNRTYKIGKHILQYDMSNDTIDQVGKVTVYSSRVKIITTDIYYFHSFEPLWSYDEVGTLVFNQSNTNIHLGEDGKVYMNLAVRGKKVSNVKVYAWINKPPLVTKYTNLEVTPGHILAEPEPGQSQSQVTDTLTMFPDGSTGSKFTIEKYVEYNKRFEEISASVNYGKYGASIYIANMPVSYVPNLKEYTARFIRHDGTQASTADVPITLMFEPEQYLTTIAVVYTYETGEILVKTSGSGKAYRTTHDSVSAYRRYVMLNLPYGGPKSNITAVNTYLQNLADRTRSSATKAAVQGRITVLGDETLDLRTRVNGYETVRITHDFSNGYLTHIDLTEEQFYKGIVTVTYVQEASTARRLYAGKLHRQISNYELASIEKLAGAVQEYKQPEEPKTGGGIFTD